MEKVSTTIEGVYIIKGKKFEDIRGQLIKPYSSEFMPPGLNLQFKEVWFTKSTHNVLRGMHLQVQPYGCEKLVSVIQGSVEDVILDLRENSNTYGKTFSIVLTDEDINSLYIPYGCAHGYKVLTKNAIVMYMATEVNVGSCDIGIRWDSFDYDWKVNNPIISEKDKTLDKFVINQTKY